MEYEVSIHSSVEKCTCGQKRDTEGIFSPWDTEEGERIIIYKCPKCGLEEELLILKIDAYEPPDRKNKEGRRFIIYRIFDSSHKERDGILCVGCHHDDYPDCKLYCNAYEKKSPYCDIDKPYIDFETERLHIRTVIEKDKESYMSLRVDNSRISDMYSLITGLHTDEWGRELESDSDIYLSTFLKESESFIASASIQKFRENTIELGYDVADEYRNQGYATEIVRSLLDVCHNSFSGIKVVIRIDRDNMASRRVAEKCGGVMVEEEDSFAARALRIFKNELRGIDIQGKDINEVIKQGEKAVCVYEMP